MKTSWFKRGEISRRSSDYADQYPDSSDLHKPLYGPLKRDGFVRVQNKKFGLTGRGLDHAKQLRLPEQNDSTEPQRIQRDQRIEIERLSKKPSVALVREGKMDALVDTDLYDFYGVTVRTKPADFIGRITTVDAAIRAASDSQDPAVDLQRLTWIEATRDELKRKWADLITDLSSATQKTRS